MGRENGNQAIGGRDAYPNGWRTCESRVAVGAATFGVPAAVLVYFLSGSGGR